MSIRDVRAGVTQAPVNQQSSKFMAAEIAVLTAAMWGYSHDGAATIATGLFLAVLWVLIAQSKRAADVVSVLLGLAWAGGTAVLLDLLGTREIVTGLIAFAVFLFTAGLHIQAFTYVSDLAAQDNE